MSRDDPNLRLRHMLDYSREAVELLRDRKRADLDSERALGLAILRCVEIVGEAASRVPVDIQQFYQDIPWPQIIGMRNRLVHGYDIWITISSGARSPKICRRFVAELEKILSSGL